MAETGGLGTVDESPLTPKGFALRLLSSEPNAARGLRAEEQVRRDDEVTTLKFAGYSFRQIGTRLGISGQAAWTAYHRALRRRGRALQQPERERRKYIALIDSLMAPDIKALLAAPPPTVSAEEIAAYAARIEGAHDRVRAWMPVLLNLKHLVDRRPVSVNIGEKAGATIREAHAHFQFDPRTATAEERKALVELARQARAIGARRSEPGPARGGTP